MPDDDGKDSSKWRGSLAKLSRGDPHAFILDEMAALLKPLTTSIEPADRFRTLIQRILGNRGRYRLQPLDVLAGFRICWGRLITACGAAAGTNFIRY